MLTYSCKHEPDFVEVVIPPPPVYTGACNPDTVYFENHISPILATRCGLSSCHDDETQQSDIIMMDYATLMNSGIVIPGDSLGSLMYQMINGLGSADMPPDGEMTLTQNQKNQIARWIAQGAINNVCDEACDTTNVSYAEDILPIIEDRCQWCHGEGPNVAGDFLLVGYSHISNAALNGVIMNAILGENGYESMPSVGPPLSNCQIHLIQEWIEDGAPNN